MTFDFDSRDQLARVNRDGIQRLAFDYDFAGLRVKKIGLTETRYVYDDRAIVQEYDAQSLGTRLKYDYGVGLLSLTQEPSHQVGFYLVDGLRSVSELTDEGGNAQVSYVYDVWGGRRDVNGVSLNPRRYTGHFFDEETGFYYFGARYYDDTIGRFLNADPYLGEPDTPLSSHRYAYALDNPTRYTDPTGYFFTPETAWDAVSLGVGVVALHQDLKDKNYSWAALDAFGVILDTIAVLTPIVPGGAGEALKAYRAWEGFRALRAIHTTLSVAQGAYISIEEYRKGNQGWAAFYGGVTLLGAKGLRDELRSLNGVVKEGTEITTQVAPKLRELNHKGVPLSTMSNDPAVKKFFSSNFPVSAVNDQARIVIQRVLGEEGVEIGIRAADANTAVAARRIDELVTDQFGRRGLPAKNLKAKGKTKDAVIAAGNTIMMTDYDIAFARRVGEKGAKAVLTNDEVLKLTKKLNEALLDAGIRPKFMHGAHNAMSDVVANIRAGRTPNWLVNGFRKTVAEFEQHPGKFPSGFTPPRTVEEHLQAVFRDVKGPGSVEILRGQERFILTERETYQYALRNEILWHPAWKLEREVPKALEPFMGLRLIAK